MSKIAVYSKTGTQLGIVESLELHDEWMAECYVTVTVKSPLPIDFGVGDYIDYRGERFTIQYDPTALKKARRGTYGEGFTYESIKFVGVQDEIVRCDFNDIVLNENGIHYTALPTFPFFCANVDDLLDRIQANLEDLYPGQWMVICLDPVRTAERGELVDRRAEFVAAYNQYIGEGTEFTYEKTNIAETVDNINCWEALRKVHDDFALNFIIRGRVVVVGGTGYYSAMNFKYGKGHGLYELEKIGDSSQQITTRLRAYGNTTNLPSRYYANLNMRIYGTALDGGTNSTDIDVIFRKDYFLNPWNGSETNIVVQIGETVYPNAVAYKNAVDETIIINTRTSDPITQGTKIYILSGVDEDKWPVSNREYGSENLPDNMAVSRLMLPGFPLQSLADWVEAHYELEGYEWLADAVAKGYTFSTSKYRPYIDSPNINKYGIRPSSIYFDGSNDNEDIHPTLEGTGVDVVVAADQIQDNGVYDTGDVPNFKITLPDLGFDLGEYWQKHTTGSIDMKDGMCGSRSFEIAKRPKQNDNNQWVCEVKRTHDDVLDLWFPYKDFNIQAGDHYTLSEIDMPDYYVEKNAEKLLKAAIEALSKNDYPRLTYQPRIDAEFMQRQDDTAKASGGAVQSLHDTLKAGDLFTFEDTDLDIDASIVIDVLTIKEYGENGIPSYEITLRDEKSVSPIEKISSKVESIISGETPVGGYTTKQIGSLIETYGEDIFLSKIYDDVAQGNMDFQQSLSVGNDLDVGGNAHIIGQTRIDGLLRALANIITNRIESEHYEGGWDNPFGSGFQINERSTDHVSFLSVDNLFVRMKAVFTELEIRKISYAGGNIIFSHAGSRIVSVTPLYDTCDLTFDGTKAVLDGSAEFAGTELQINAGGAFDGTTLKFNDSAQKLVGYRCYLMKDDGTTATENWWRVDDQARCQTFNIDETGTYHNVSNSFYWRRVMAVGTELLEDGMNYDYVDLSIIDAAAGSTVPQAGDTIVQMGNRTDTDRQGFISIQVAGEYAPSFEVYKGVNSYNLSGKRKICISPKYTEIRANKIIESTETGDYPLPHFRTDPWYTGMQCYYYDVVQHNGSSWLCIYPEGGIGGVPYTTEEPSDHATYWRIFASEGKEGKTGGETLTVYAWGTSDETAPAISGNAYPPAGWSTRITDRPTGGDYYLWMAETKKDTEGVIADWGIPACISGADGTPGEDAKNIEFIYKYDASGYDGNTGQVSPSGAASGSDTNKQQDDWVPNGWYDRALAVSESNPDVYMSSRKYNASTGTWGAFGTPTLWGHYGQKGIDGDGVQYVYKLFDHELTDAERTSNIPTKPAEPNPQGEWIPTDWSDDPQAPISSMAFCYCSIIKEINGVWGNFEKLGLWSKWAYDGTPGGNTATVMLYKRSASAVTSVGISSTLYYKFSTKKLYTDAACTTEATTQLNGWSLTIPSNSTNQIYVTAAIAFSNTTSDDIASNEWVTPAQFTENGEDGAHGVNTATIFLYKRSATAITAHGITTTLYYKFTDGKLYTKSGSTYTEATDANLNNWKREIPTVDGNPCYIIQAVALGTDDYDQIATSDWSSVRMLVEDGKSPYFADIDNEMESVACDNTGKTKAAFDQTVGVNMWHGSTAIAFTISTTSVTGITINTDATNKTIRFRVAANTSLAEVNDIAITLTASDGSGEVRTLHYVLNAVRAGGKGDPGDDAIIYTLVPSVSAVTKKKDGSYSVTNVSCTRQKNVGGTITDNTTDGTITYKIDGGATEHSYTNNTNIPVTDFTKSLQFIFRVDSKIVDIETIPLVADGEDGLSAAVALLTPQVVSIPVNSSDQALDDFRQIVPISMTTSSEELSLFEVTILSGGTNVELGPSVLKSHAGSQTTFSSNTAVIGDAHFNGTTLVVEDEGSTLVPTTLIVKGAKNATITEHVCEIQVRGYDSEMNEYTAKTSLSIVRNVEGKDGQNGTDGEDGADAVNVSLTPQSVILTQNEAGAMPTLTDAYTIIDVKKGDSDVTSQATIVSATPSTYVVSGVTYDTCTCQISGNRVIITAIDQHGTETVEGETINKYAEQGYIDIVVRFGGVNTTVRFNFYCNLLGTWKREVEGDTEHIIATKQFAVYDKDGHVVTHQTMGDYIHSSSENTAKLTDATTDSSGNYIKSSELKQTADGLTSDVSSIKMGKNMLKGALSGSNFRCENIMPYPVHQPVRPVVATNGWMEAPSGNTYICAPDITITRGKWYVLSFYTKYTSSIIVTTWSSGSQPDQQLSISAGTSDTRHYTAFKYGGTGSVTITICFPVTTLRYPQLELGVNNGNDTDGQNSTPTAFEVDSAVETSSRITQSSTEIDASIKNGLNTTGINITDGTIKLKATKVNFYDSTGSSLNSKIWLDNSTGALHAVDGEFSGKITAGEGEVGGFNIGSTSLGTTTPYGQTGYTFIQRDGKINISNSDNGYDYGLSVNGGVNLLGTAAKKLILRNNTGEININGNPLNLNTDANSGAYTYIGNFQSNVVVNAGNTTFNDQVNLNEETNVGSNGVMTIQGILAMNSSVQTQSFILPDKPKVGQVFFCKSLESALGDLVISANTGQTIMASDSRSTSTQVNIQDNSAFVVCMSTNSWVLFRCN